jgi:hypothetical protein
MMEIEEVKGVGKYSDDEIRNRKKITCKIAAVYLGISPMAVSIGMRNDLLPIGFAIKNEDRFSESWSYHIIDERLIAYKHICMQEKRPLCHPRSKGQEQLFQI